MKPVPSTAEILAFKMLGRPVDKRWGDWAYEMLLAGFETENLIILAGETEPFNQFEVKPLTDKVFSELGLTCEDEEAIYKNYISYLINRCLNNELTALSTLSKIKDLYEETNYDARFNDFYMLYWAYDNLIHSENQWYWPGATRENISEIIRNYFLEWLGKFNPQ